MSYESDPFDFPSVEQRDWAHKAVDAWKAIHHHLGISISAEGDDAIRTWNTLCALMEDLRERLEIEDAEACMGNPRPTRQIGERQMLREALMAAQATLCLLAGNKQYPIAEYKDARRKQTLEIVTRAINTSDCSRGNSSSGLVKQ